MTLVQKFTEKYGINPIQLVADAHLKNLGLAKAFLNRLEKTQRLQRLLENYIEDKNLKIEVNNEFIKDLVECFAEAKEKFPENVKATVDTGTKFEIPNQMSSIPKSKGTLENFKDIVGTDDLRPIMMGVYVSEDGFIVGTDAHKLVKQKNNGLLSQTDYAGKIIDLTKYIKSNGKLIDFVDGVFPKYDAVIPRESPYEDRQLSTYAFYNYAKSSLEVKRLLNSDIFNVNFNLMTDTSGGTKRFSFGYHVLLDALNFAMLNNWDFFTLRYSEPNRAVLFDFGGDNVILVMPMIDRYDSSAEGGSTGTIPLTTEEVEEKYRLGLKQQKSSKPAKAPKKATVSAPVSSEPFKKFEGNLSDTTYIPRREIASITLRNGDVLSGNDVIDGFYRVNKKMAHGGGVEEQDEPYSKYLYTEKDWESIKTFLEKTYTQEQTDKIMRSRWMRKIGRKENFKNFVLFFNEYKRYLDQMLEEEEKESSNGVSMYSNIKVEQDEPYSKYLYTEKDWESIKTFLKKRYTAEETDKIMRSRNMRKLGAKENYKNFVKFYNEKKIYFDRVLEEENEYAYGGSMYADGGSISKYSIDGYDLERLQESGMTIKEIDKLLMKAFPYSFGFELFPFKDDSFSTYQYLIPNTDNYKGIQDESLKLSFDKFHRMTYRVFQGQENTYFYFMLDGNDDKSYIGTFGFKDRGDVSKEYVTSFIALLTKLYGFPFKVSHEVYGQGGSMYADGGGISKGMASGDISFLQKNGYYFDGEFYFEADGEFIEVVQGTSPSNPRKVAVLFRTNEPITISRAMLDKISSSFGKDFHIELFTNAGVDLHSSANRKYKNISVERLPQSKMAHGGSMFADGGNTGRVKVGVFSEADLRSGADKKAIEKAQQETGLTYIDNKVIKKGGKMFMEVYLVPTEEYLNSNKFENGGGVGELTDFNKELIAERGYNIGDNIVFSIGEKGNTLFPYKEVTGHKIASFKEKGKHKDLHIVTDKGYVIDYYAILSKYAKGGGIEGLKVGSKVGFLRPRIGRYEWAEVLSIDGDNVNLVVRHPKRKQWDNYFTETKQRIEKYINTVDENWHDGRGRTTMKIKYEHGGSMYADGGNMFETPIAKYKEVSGKVVGSVPVSEEVYSSQVKDFVEYVYEVYEDYGFTKKQVKEAVDKYIKELGYQFTWGGGDSLDRERVYEYLRNPNLQGIKNPSFANGGSMSKSYEIGDIISFNSVMGGTKTGAIVSKLGEDGFRIKTEDGFATVKKSAIV